MSMFLSIINDSLKEINNSVQVRINQLKKEGSRAFSEGDLELVQCLLKEGRFQKQALMHSAELQDEWAQLIEIHTFVINHSADLPGLDLIINTQDPREKLARVVESLIESFIQAGSEAFELFNLDLAQSLCKHAFCLQNFQKLMLEIFESNNFTESKDSSKISIAQ